MTPRIACLVPSITELVFALGLGHRLVARTGFCIHPAAAVRAVPKVGGTKDLDLERLRALAPTHAIVNVDENRREQVDALRRFVPEILVTHPGAPQDTLALIDQVADAFAAEPGVAARAAALRAQLCKELARTRPEGRPAVPVLYLIWREPYRFDARDLAPAQALCPHARVRLADGELLSWYGPRTAAGLGYLRGLAAEG